MNLDSLDVTALVLYTAWTTYIMHQRYQEDKSRTSLIKWVYAGEVAYCMSMLYLLHNESKLTD